METVQDLFNISCDLEKTLAKSLNLPYSTEKLLIVVLTGTACIRITVTNRNSTEQYHKYMFCDPGTNVICLCKDLRNQRTKKQNNLKISVLNQDEIPDTMVYVKNNMTLDPSNQWLRHHSRYQSHTEQFLVTSDATEPMSLQLQLATAFAMNQVNTDTFFSYRNSMINPQLIKLFSINPHQEFLMARPQHSICFDIVLGEGGHRFPLRATDKVCPWITTTIYKEIYPLLHPCRAQRLFWSEFSPHLQFVFYEVDKPSAAQRTQIRRQLHRNLGMLLY